MLDSLIHAYSHEHKEHAAIEAAQDPNSSVTVDEAETIIKEQARASGAPTYSFDPNASPEAKAEQAKAVS